MNKEKIFKKLGLRAGIPTFLMMTSGVSKDFLKKVVEKILHIETDFQMAITTKEKETRDILKNLTKKAKEKFKIMGYINNVEEWLTVSDLSISKPGGLVVSESIAKGVPMLILSPVPGQEELNSNYLLENGAAMTADTPEVVDYKINTLLRNSKKLVIMKNHARTLGKPNAAMDIAKDIMNSLG
ncbi:MAG: Monogalactosyldiacylglycerol synthase [uncultured bacterium]|nr:MAG: Monogalactosyldiacylglycerol synthase [uncultured bacterium]